MTEYSLRSGRRPGTGELHLENALGAAEGAEGVEGVEDAGGDRGAGQTTAIGGSRDVAGQSKGLSRRLLTAALVICLVTAPSLGLANSKAAETSRESGLGAAAAVSSLVYGPIKLVYALGGLVVGGFAWAFTAGDSEVASTVFTRSLRGTYVITPQILLGEEQLIFIGRDVDNEPIRTETVAAADPAPATYEDSGYDEMGW